MHPEYFSLQSIGYIYTPYREQAPFQPQKNATGDFFILLDKKYTDGLKELSTFKYIYILFYFNKAVRDTKMEVRPPWSHHKEVGVFASRSPNRPNPIGLSIVTLKKIEGNKLYISGIDAYNGSPVLDIKPYIDELDAKKEANFGWIKESGELEHLKLHINGIAH